MAEKLIPDAFKTSHRWATEAEVKSKLSRSALEEALANVLKQRAALDAEEARLVTLLDHLPSVQEAKPLTFLEHAEGWLVKLAVLLALLFGAGCGSSVGAKCKYDPVTKAWECGVDVVTPHVHGADGEVEK